MYTPSLMRLVERYHINDEPIASGGMASVHLARLESEGGFSKIVAVKLMHAHLARDRDFRTMFLDEARTVSRIRHTNVVSTLDILGDGDRLVLVMDYVHGPPLSTILRQMRDQDSYMPLPIVGKLVCDMLEGLHAAHDARAESGEPLNIVHRDVSPHNLLVGADGTARVMDFGIATATDRSYATKTGEVKGKPSYMAPEQARGERVDRRADVYSAGTVLFELLTNRTPFAGGFSETVFKVLLEPPAPPSALRSAVSDELDAIVLRALAKTSSERFPTARAMGESLRDVINLATAQEVSGWVRNNVEGFFEERDALLARFSAEPARRQESTEPAATSVPDARMQGEVTAATVLRGASATPDVPPLPSPTRTTAARWLGLGVAVVTAAATFATASRTSPTSSGSTEPEPSQSPLALGPAAAPPAGELVLGPAPQSSAGSQLAEGAPVATASAPGQRESSGPLRGRARLSQPAASSARETASPPSRSPPPPAPQCCIQIAGTWQRFSFRADCINNCPAGTP